MYWCICVYVCGVMFVHACVLVCVHMHIGTFVCGFALVRLCINVYVYECWYVCIAKFSHVRFRIYMCSHANACMRIYLI